MFNSLSRTACLVILLNFSASTFASPIHHRDFVLGEAPPLDLEIQVESRTTVGDSLNQVGLVFRYLLCVLASDVFAAISIRKASTFYPVCIDPSAVSKIVNSLNANANYTLPLPPSPTCAPQYRDISSGAVYGPGIGTFPMNPRPTSFVTSNGKTLMLDGEDYRIVGPNIYWLGLVEDDGEGPSYPSQGRIREAFAIAVAMGATTVRSHTLGVSTGNPLSIWPAANVTNPAAFDSIDYAIAAARNYGVRLIIPLTDEYQYYHGGKFDFIRWAGLPLNNSAVFYTNPNVINLYKAYISTVLNHVNSYTGVALKDDPTILGWELGNELGAYNLRSGAPPASWSVAIASHIKSIAPRHLVIDGSDGLINDAGKLATNALQVAAVDIVSDHLYPPSVWQLQNDALIMNKTSKNFLVGEFDWTNRHGGDSLASFYSELESIPGSGSMLWSVVSHDDSCCAWINHNDAIGNSPQGGYTMQYPNGNVTMMPQVLAVVQHWHRMRGMFPPQTLPAVACPQPELIFLHDTTLSNTTSISSTAITTPITKPITTPVTITPVTTSITTPITSSSASSTTISRSITSSTTIPHTSISTTSTTSSTSVKSSKPTALSA